MQNGCEEAIIHASSEMSQSYNFANFTTAVFVPKASPTIRCTYNKRRVYKDKANPVLVHRSATEHHRCCLHGEPVIKAANI